MKPWYLDSEKVTLFMDSMCVNTPAAELHDFAEAVCDELWRKGEMYCHRERMLKNGCSSECSLCRPNN